MIELKSHVEHLFEVIFAALLLDIAYLEFDLFDVIQDNDLKNEHIDIRLHLRLQPEHHQHIAVFFYNGIQFALRHVHNVVM